MKQTSIAAGCSMPPQGGLLLPMEAVAPGGKASSRSTHASKAKPAAKGLGGRLPPGCSRRSILREDPVAADRDPIRRGEEIVAVRPQFLAAQQRPGRGRKPVHHLCRMARSATKVPIGVPRVETGRVPGGHVRLELGVRPGVRRQL